MAENYFYKYFTINQNLFSSIINNELFFSNPRNFNDPFDSYPRFLKTNDEDKLANFFLYIKNTLNELGFNSSKLLDNKTLTEKYETLLSVYEKLNLFDEEFYTNTIDDKDEKIIELISFYNNEKYFFKLLKQNKDFLQVKLYYDFIFLTIDINEFGVSCGSKNPKCPLMWGHYGNDHKGICLKFEFYDNGEQKILYDDKKKLEILNVTYSNKPIDIFSYSFEELKILRLELLSNKYSKWEYEEEVRLINHGQGLFKFNKKIVKEIIFGCRSSPKDRYSLLKLFASLGYEIENLLIAKRLSDQYELSIENMKINDIAGSGVYINELNVKNSF